MKKPMTNINLGEFLNDPEQGIKTLIDDFQTQMRIRGVSDDAIHGMTIALQIAYRLGENAAVRKIAKGEK